LKPGETKTVSFAVTINELKFYNYDLKYDWEPGEFEIMIGGNSSEVQTVKVQWNK
jgi:beta-glucosidase